MNRRQLASLSLIAFALVAFAWASQTYYTYAPVAYRQATWTPTATLTPTITPTQRPLLDCAPSSGTTSQFASSRGVAGNAFKLVTTCALPGEDVWFEFKVTNNGSYQYVGGLGAIWCTNKPGQCTQASWGDFWFDNQPGSNPNDPNNVIPWNDHANIATSGVYQVRLGICWLADRNACEQNPGSWEYLSGPVTLTIR